MLAIAGIGSRKSPDNILKEMMAVGVWCREHDIYVYSGHAKGADYAFEEGAGDHCLAFLPWSGFMKELPILGKSMIINPVQQLIDITNKFHPNPSRLSYGGMKLMCRNVCQVLGADLKSPVIAVVCYTSDGKDSGGTGQAIRIATAYSIPILNLRNYKDPKVVLSDLGDIVKRCNNGRHSRQMVATEV